MTTFPLPDDFYPQPQAPSFKGHQKSIENGKLQVLSPSLLNAFDSSAAFGCERRGWFKYVKGLPEPTTDAMTRGTHLHAMNEEYLRTGKLLLGTPEQTAWFNAGRHFLDVLRTDADTAVNHLWIEQSLPADFRVYGVPVSPMSKCDVVTETGIIDWKTTSDIEKYGKTPGQLAKDVQMLIYAKAFHPSAERVTLTHGQYQTKGRVRFQASSVELTRNELDTNYERVILPLVEKVKAIAAVTDVNEVTPVATDRSDHRCRKCPHSAVCPTEKASIIMSIFDRLKKANAAVTAENQKADEQMTVTGRASYGAASSLLDKEMKEHPEKFRLENAILPPDAPPSKPELAAKPVEGFEAVPPPRRNLIVEIQSDAHMDAPTVPAGTVIPRLGPDDPMDMEATSEHPPKKRGPGRPPGTKNKKSTVDAIADGMKSIPMGLSPVPEKYLTGGVEFESVTVNYGLTLNLGNFSSVRFDVTMGAKGSNPDATYEAVMARVRAKVTEEIEKIQAEQKAAQTLNPNGKEK